MSSRRTLVDIPPEQFARIRAKLADHYPFPVETSNSAIARSAFDLLEAWLDNPSADALTMAWVAWLATGHPQQQVQQ